MTKATQHGVRLTGDKVRLREFRLEDLDDADAILGDDRVTGGCPSTLEPVSSKPRCSPAPSNAPNTPPRTEYYLAVTTHIDERMIGFVRLGIGGVQAAKLGAAIAAAHRGHGYALDATRTIINFGFATLGLHRISGAIGPDNAASIALVTRLGFTHEGRLRDHVFTNGAWRDSILYSLLAHE